MNNQVLILKNTQKYFKVHEWAVLCISEIFRTDREVYSTKINMYLLNAPLQAGIEHHFPSAQGRGSHQTQVFCSNGTDQSHWLQKARFQEESVCSLNLYTLGLYLNTSSQIRLLSCFIFHVQILFTSIFNILEITACEDCIKSSNTEAIERHGNVCRKKHKSRRLIMTIVWTV